MQSGTFTISDLDATALAILSLGIDVARWYRDGIDPEPDALGEQYAGLVLMMLGVQPD